MRWDVREFCSALGKCVFMCISCLSVYLNCSVVGGSMCVRRATWEVDLSLRRCKGINYICRNWSQKFVFLFYLHALTTNGLNTVLISAVLWLCCVYCDNNLSFCLLCWAAGTVLESIRCLHKTWFKRNQLAEGWPMLIYRGVTLCRSSWEDNALHGKAALEWRLKVIDILLIVS